MTGALQWAPAVTAGRRMGGAEPAKRNPRRPPSIATSTPARTGHTPSRGEFRCRSPSPNRRPHAQRRLAPRGRPRRDFREHRNAWPVGDAADGQEHQLRPAGREQLLHHMHHLQARAGPRSDLRGRLQRPIGGGEKVGR
jgi:hypothetical protein